jgi:hypothetical protein
MTRHMLVAVMVAGLIVGCMQAALADNGLGPIQCAQGDPGCTLTAGSSGSPGEGGGQPTTTGGSAGNSGSAGGGGGPTQAPPTAPVPPPCTYAADPSYQPPAGSAAHAPGSGAWYEATCYQYMNAAKTGWVPNLSEVWLATPPPPKTVLPSPETLAALAQSQLALAKPTLESNPAPGLPQLVGVPMWAWVPTGQFAPITATAMVPGESVTATATPDSVTWSWGDGTSTTCSGPGTPYSSGDGPTATSPTCGHTYTRDSGIGDFTVSATIIWTVNWAGAGQTGAFNDLTTTATEAVHVEQSRALVTGG